MALAKHVNQRCVLVLQQCAKEDIVLVVVRHLAVMHDRFVMHLPRQCVSDAIGSFKVALRSSGDSAHLSLYHEGAAILVL